jgi:hypothetical protein
VLGGGVLKGIVRSRREGGSERRMEKLENEKFYNCTFQ